MNAILAIILVISVPSLLVAMLWMYKDRDTWRDLSNGWERFYNRCEKDYLKALDKIEELEEEARCKSRSQKNT